MNMFFVSKQYYFCGALLFPGEHWMSTTRHVKERLLGTIIQTTAAVTAIGAYKHSRGTGSVN